MQRPDATGRLVPWALAAMTVLALPWPTLAQDAPAQRTRGFSATEAVRSPDEMRALRQRILRNRAIKLETPRTRVLVSLDEGCT